MPLSPPRVFSSRPIRPGAFSEARATFDIRESSVYCKADENMWDESRLADYVPVHPEDATYSPIANADGRFAHHEFTRVAQLLDLSRPWRAWAWTTEQDDPARASLTLAHFHTANWTTRVGAVHQPFMQALADEYSHWESAAKQAASKLAWHRLKLPDDAFATWQDLNDWQWSNHTLEHLVAVGARLQRSVVEMRGYALWADFTLAQRDGRIAGVEPVMPVVGCWVGISDIGTWIDLAHAGVPCWRRTSAPPRYPAARLVERSPLPPDLSTELWDDEIHHVQPRSTMGKRRRRALEQADLERDRGHDLLADDLLLIADGHHPPRPDASDEQYWEEVADARRYSTLAPDAPAPPQLPYFDHLAPTAPPADLRTSSPNRGRRQQRAQTRAQPFVARDDRHWRDRSSSPPRRRSVSRHWSPPRHQYARRRSSSRHWSPSRRSQVSYDRGRTRSPSRGRSPNSHSPSPRGSARASRPSFRNPSSPTRSPSAIQSPAPTAQRVPDRARSRSVSSAISMASPEPPSPPHASVPRRSPSPPPRLSLSRRLRSASPRAAPVSPAETSSERQSPGLAATPSPVPLLRRLGGGGLASRIAMEDEDAIDVSPSPDPDSAASLPLATPPPPSPSPPPVLPLHAREPVLFAAPHVVPDLRGQPVLTTVPVFGEEVAAFLSDQWLSSTDVSYSLATWEMHGSTLAPFIGNVTLLPVPPMVQLNSLLHVYHWRSMRNHIASILDLRPPIEWEGGRATWWRNRLKGKGPSAAVFKGDPHSHPAAEDLAHLTDKEGVPWIRLSDEDVDMLRWEVRTFLFRRDFERLILLRHPSQPLVTGNHAALVALRARLRRVWGPGPTFFPRAHEPRWLDHPDELFARRAWRGFGYLLLD
ncbi:hypothetical protein FA95DRAFT_1613556, partial [Auriscalpium vulgare]